jgi:cytochrome b6-f complex iron-sulfur subunit
MTVTPTTAKVDDSPVSSRLKPEPVPRRDFLGLASLWSAGAALLFAALGMMRLPKAAVLSSPSKKFRVSLPESLAAGQAFEPPGHAVAMFRDDDGVYAISKICTHLGCVVRNAGKDFECPCHGSRFATDGTVTKGPAPRPLPWYRVTRVGKDYVVDEDETVPPGTKEPA